MKKSSLPGFGVYRKFSLVCLTNLLGDIQAEARARFARCEKWFKNLSELGFVDAWAIVSDGYYAKSGGFVFGQRQPLF